jgi:hypothetical protein
MLRELEEIRAKKKQDYEYIINELKELRKSINELKDESTIFQKNISKKIDSFIQRDHPMEFVTTPPGAFTRLEPLEDVAGAAFYTELKTEEVIATPSICHQCKGYSLCKYPMCGEVILDTECDQYQYRELK